MKYLIIASVFSFVFSCCKKKIEEYQPIVLPCQASKNLDTIMQYIKGTWQWLEEKRIDRGQQKFIYLTPQNQGYSLILQLSDSIAKFYKNNQQDSIYTYRIIRLTELTGTNFPEDQDPVLVFYSIHNGQRRSHVPLKICSNYLLLQYQFVRTIEGEQIWRKL